MNRAIVVLITSLALAACSARSPVSGAGPSISAYRIVDTGIERSIGLADLGERASEVDVVYFGELHDDRVTHDLQRALLEEVSRHTDLVVLSLEMFERDIQGHLDAYLSGEISEAEFLAESRPWPNYTSDYRPLVEFARDRGWPVLASNVPRPLAARVARGGLDTLSLLTPAERDLVADEVSCPLDGYYDRFVEAMGDHPMGDEAMIVRFYEAQCIKDETMAESITAILEADPGVVVIHMNGAFHSDFGEGIPARVERRRPGTRALILSGIPVPDPDAEVAPGATEGAQGQEDQRARADILIYTRQSELGVRPPS